MVSTVCALCGFHLGEPASLELLVLLTRLKLVPLTLDKLMLIRLNGVKCFNAFIFPYVKHKVAKFP